MKTKVKRMSKRSIAIVLGVLMLVTSLFVGSVQTANAWHTDGTDKIYIKIGTGSWESYNTNSDGYINFTIGVDCYCEWVFYSQSGSNKYCYRLKGGDSVPSGAMGDSTDYYAKKSTGHTGGTGNENYYKKLPAGEYVVQFINPEDGQLKYHMYRKRMAVYGEFNDGTSNWNNDHLMTYQGGSYYYKVIGDGNTYKYRYRVESKNYESYNYVNINSGSYNSYANAYGAREGTSQCWYFNTDRDHVYYIWIQGEKTWITTAANEEFYLTGLLNNTSETTTSSNRKFTKTGTNTFELTYKFTADNGGYQYATIYDGVNAYHPTRSDASSGTAGTSYDKAPGNNTKWKIEAATGQTVVFTWNSSTKVLTWENIVTYSYYVTSSGSTDEDTGFTSNIWDADDADGGMEADDSETGYDYSKTFHNVPIGTYRFKITDGTWSNTWGDDGNINYNDAGNTANQTKENNGNAKFDITRASNVTIYFNSSTHAIKVKTTNATVADKYYIVGAASDGTRGMFANVWGENGTSFNSADEITITSNSGTKEYTDFNGTTGTYTYKLAKVTGSGVEYYPSEGQTVNVKSNTTKVTFTVDTRGDTPTISAATTEGSSGSVTWPPAEINILSANENGYIRYINATGSDAFAAIDSTNIKFKRPVYNGQYWWFDMYDSSDPSVGFGDLSTMLSDSNIYYSLANDQDYSGNNWYDHIWRNNTATNVTVGTTGISSTDTDNSDKHYVGLYSIPANTTHVGVKITDSGGKFNYTYYITTESSGGSSTTLQTVDIYAKNGCLRDSTFNRFTNVANTDIISITDPDGIVHTNSDWASSSAGWLSSGSGTWEKDKTGYSSNYDKITKVPVGSKVKLRTYLSSSSSTTGSFGGNAFKDTHYLKAYSFNGTTYQLHTASEAKSAATGYKFGAGDAYYEEEWTVEAVNSTYMGDDGDVVEITPIYYMKDNTNTKTFYIDGYIGDLQTKWGTMLSVYPYYEGKNNKDNAFGGYPGQPMLFWGGKYQMEVPLTVDGTATGASVKGLTMHNSYWDLLHRALDKKCDDGHCQTYDYDDFYKLYKEKNADTIYFWFKYKTAHDNYNDGYEYTTYDFVTSKSDTGIQTSSSTKNKTTIGKIESCNGAEIVTDYYGRAVDVFGNRLNSDTKSTYTTDAASLKGTELLLVSTGYKDTYVGEYGTIWAVYTQDETKGNFTFLGYISSSMLYLNSINSVNNYTGGTNTANGKMSWGNESNKGFKWTYEQLAASYKNRPVLISYEKEIYNNSKDKANRSDGKWFYSMGTDKISANIKIQYSSSTSAKLMDATGWTDDEFSNVDTGFGEEFNVGTTTGCSAYFTNTSPYLVGKTSASNILVDNEKHFTFKADAGGTYEFVGWVRECGGELNPISSTNGVGESNISSNDTYIARFKPVATGKLVISHNIKKSSTYKGDGTKYLKVQVYDSSDNLKKEYIRTDGTDVDVSDYIKSTTTGYKIKVTLTTVPDEDCTVETRQCVPNDDAFSTGSFTPASGVTLTQTKEFNVSDVFSGSASTVTAVRYYTSLTKTAMTYNYNITYHYTSRFWGDQTYTVSGENINELVSSEYFEGTKTGALLTDEFIKNSTPFEKNFGSTINWNYTDSDKSYTYKGVEKTASAMTKGCSSPSANTYMLTAEVWATNTIDDKVKAEFLLPYKYKDTDKSPDPLPIYTAADGTQTGDESYAFDEDSYESFTLTSQVGKLFQYDNSVSENYAQAGEHASSYKLVEAAPYILYKSNDGSKYTYVDFHHKQKSKKRYFTGNSFTIGDKTYYLKASDCPNGTPDATHIVLTVNDKVRVWKPEKHDTLDDNDPYWNETTGGTVYSYAVEDTEKNQVYFFAYNLGTVNGVDDVPVDNNGNEVTNPEDYVFNGQYIVYSLEDKSDGIIKLSDDQNYGYQKKYFSYWAVYNSKGEEVARSYYEQFNYSGYENYTIKPIYDSDTENAAASTSGLSATISYLGDSRNQWKGTSSSDTTARGDYATVTGDSSSATWAGDKLFADFAISYNYYDQQLSTISKDDATIQIGMVIEKLAAVQTVDDHAVTDPKYYAENSSYNTYDNAQMTAYVKGKIENTSPSRPNTGSSQGTTFVTFGTNANGFAGNATSEALFGSGTPMLDNKNRMQYFYTFTKSANGTAVTTGRTVDRVYRVTSYIYVKPVSGGEATVSISAPIYFTLYDTANK